MIEIKSDSGIPVIAEQNAHLHGFSLALYLKAGCLYETKSENGITHFYEHIAIRNLNARYDGALYRMLDTYGLTLNASTGQENVQFEIIGATKHFRIACEILSKLFEPITLSANEIDIERKRVKAEIREDDEKSTLYQFRSVQVWQDTPLSLSVLGTPKTLDSFGKQRLIVEQKNLLSPNNVFFYATGAFEECDLLYLTSLLSKVTIPPSSQTRDNCAILPQAFGNRPFGIHVKGGDETVLSFSFDLYAEEYTDAERTLLYDLLFSGETSLFYQALSEKTGYIYSFTPSFEVFCNIAVLSVQFEVHPKHLLAAAEEAVAVFASVKRDIGDALDRVRPPYVDNAGLLLDDCSSYNWTRAYETRFLRLPYEDTTARANAFQNVTPERITALAKAVFTLPRMTVCLKGDKKRLPVETIEAILKRVLSE